MSVCRNLMSLNLFLSVGSVELQNAAIYWYYFKAYSKLFI